MPRTQESVKIAAVQAAPVSFDLPKSLAKVARFTAEAAKAGADLVVFPEGFMSAYPWRYAFDATIGSREPRGRKWYAKHYDSAVAIPSPDVDTLSRIARETIFTYPPASSRKTAAHSTLIPTAAERLVWGRGSGVGLVVAETSIAKVGGLIYWENYMPAARLALYQKGIEIWIAPNADDLPSWTATMQHIAKEGRCSVVNCNQFCKVSDFPSDYPPFAAENPSDCKANGEKWENDDVLSHGGSCVVGPLGTFLADPVWDREEIVYVELRMGDLTEARTNFDPVASYSRPDIFKLKVNKRSSTNVTFGV